MCLRNYVQVYSLGFYCSSFTTCRRVYEGFRFESLVESSRDSCLFLSQDESLIMTVECQAHTSFPTASGRPTHLQL